MRKIFTVLFSAVIALASADEVAAQKMPKVPHAPKVEDGVIVLTEENFDEVIAKHEVMMVEFWAPWCKHCINFAPEYAKTAQILAEKNPPLYLGKVDSTREFNLIKRFDITGFPALRLFVDGIPREYNGERDPESIVQYMMHKSTIHRVPCENINDVLKSRLNLMYFGEQEGEAFDLFQQASRHSGSDGYVFYRTGAECAGEYKSSDEGIAVFREFEEPVVPYNGENNIDELIAFLKAKSEPAVFVFNENYIDSVFKQPNYSIFLFQNSKSVPVYKTFVEVARKFKGKMMFGSSGFSLVPAQIKLTQLLGVTKDDSPCIVILNPPQAQKGQENPGIYKYKFDGNVAELNADELSQFIQDFFDNKLTSYMATPPKAPKKEEVTEQEVPHTEDL